MRSYLIAITPPAEICQIADRYRLQHGSKSLSDIPPHITLHQSFYVDDISEDEMIKLVADVAEAYKPHQVDLTGISYFQGVNNVLYFKPDNATQEFAKSLFLKLSDALAGRVKTRHPDFIVTAGNFSAHMTIADKIPDEAFDAIKKDAALLFTGTISFCASSVDIYYQEPDSRECKVLKKVPL